MAPKMDKAIRKDVGSSVVAMTRSRRKDKREAAFVHFLLACWEAFRSTWCQHTNQTCNLVYTTFLTWLLLSLCEINDFHFWSIYIWNSYSLRKQHWSEREKKGFYDFSYIRFECRSILLPSAIKCHRCQDLTAWRRCSEESETLKARTWLVLDYHCRHVKYMRATSICWFPTWECLWCCYIEICQVKIFLFPFF